MFEQAKIAHEVIKDPEIISILKSIDFDTLQSIFSEDASRSGIDADAIGFVSKDDIYKSPSFTGSTAYYDLEEKNIHLSTHALHLKALLDKNVDKAANVLSVLCHEEAHAVSRNSVTSHEEDVLWGLVRMQIKQAASGVRRSTLSPNPFRQESTLKWFNEGITDEYASHVFKEYLRRSPLKPHDENRDMKFTGGYPLARLFIRTLCERFAEESGIDQEIVWDSFVGMYLRGENPMEGELQEVFSEIFSEKFIDRLAKIEGDSALALIAISFKEVISPAMAKRVLKNLGSKIQTSLSNFNTSR